MNELFPPRVEAETLCEIVKRFPFPRDYLVVDIETSGFSKAKDLIVAASWGEVKNCQPGACGSVILDWTRATFIDQGRLDWQLRRVASDFAKAGRDWHYPYARLSQEGVDPLQGLHQLLVVLHNALVSRVKVVGHNVYGFDSEFIDEACRRFCPTYNLPWCDDAIYDTAVIEKSLILGKEPWVGESLGDWHDRVHRLTVKKGQAYNLPTHCVNKYDLVKRGNLDMNAAHRAEFDILLCYHLLETYRANAELVGSGS